MSQTTQWIIILIASILLAIIIDGNFFVIFIVSFVVIHIINFLVFHNKNTRKDNQTINEMNLPQHFSALINALNQWTYHGYGTIDRMGRNQFSLYSDGSCQIIYFLYASDTLAITWKFKYYHQEVVYKKELRNAKSATAERQIEFAKLIIPEFAATVEAHKRKVDSKMFGI